MSERSADVDEHLLEVYLINTARHTEETPVAEWVSLPTDAETMKAVFERLGVDGSDTEQYQVSAFHSSLDGWSEALKPGESLDDLNYLAALLTQRSNEERDKFAAAAQYGDHAASAADLINLTHNLDCYWLYPTVHNSDDYGHYLIDDLDELELPDAAKRFFDYKSYGREAVKEDRGIFTDYGYVYNNGNDYAEWYKASQVPQEYRLTAQPSPQRDMDEPPQGAALPVEPTPVRPLVLNATDTQGRIKEITEHLEQGVQEVFESERYRDYLKAMSRFHNYSLNNTLLIVSSDNGPVVDDGYNDRAVELLGDHRPWGDFRGGKYSAFEAGTRVPMLVRWRGHVPAGAVSDALLSHIDIFASLGALCGGEIPEGAAPDSRNHLSALLGGGPDREYVVEQNLNNTLSIIVDGWKYIEPSNKMRINRQTDTELGNDPMRQLYNLREDVGERHNLAGRYPAKADSLHNKLENIKRR